MIEVLVTMIIIAVGLLGLAGLQARAQRVELESYQRVQALILLEDMANRLRSNREAARCYEITAADHGEAYIGKGNDPAACSGWGTASSRVTADDDLAEWNRLLEGSAETRGGADIGAMSGARGCITYDTANDVYTVAVAWQGEVPTTTSASNCAQGLYGNDELRRVVARDVRLPELD